MWIIFALLVATFGVLGLADASPRTWNWRDER